MSGCMDGKVLIVTGAGRGIGKETALLLSKEGARTVVIDRDADTASAVAVEIKAAGGQALAIGADVTSREQLDAAVAQAVGTFGRVDVLINNAGITQDATLAKMTEAQFDRVVDINLKGVFHATQAVLPGMLAQGSGKIINASSVVGLHGNFGQTNYAATKAGVIGMTKSWAKELAKKGITANAVAPGFIQTEMTAAMPEKVLTMMADKTPLGRLGQPGDVLPGVGVLPRRRVARRHARARDDDPRRCVRGLDQAVDPALEAEAIHEDEPRLREFAPVFRRRLIGVRIPVGADDDGDAHGVSADLAQKIAEDREAGDDKKRLSCSARGRDRESGKRKQKRPA